MELEKIFNMNDALYSPIMIIAEIGVNHNGQMDLALQLIDRAAECGADAVKFQAFVPERMIVKGTSKVNYQSQTTPSGEDQYTMLKRLQLSVDQLQYLKNYAEAKGLLFMASIFDLESASRMNQLGLLVFKIPSGELTHLPLIRQVARYGKPMIISTGMASLGEVEAAVLASLEEGNRKLILLHCVSDYPASLESLNLKAMVTLAKAFQLPVGFSDHTDGMLASIASIALGASVVEKHFTLSRNLAGPDHQASFDPGQFGEFVRVIRDTEIALGDGYKKAAASELETQALTRKSIVAAVEIPEGTLITSDLLDFKRPGTGMAPEFAQAIIGRRAVRLMKIDTQITWADVE